MGSQKHEHKIKKTMNSGNFKHLRKSIQILLSVSVFSFLFSQSSLAPILLHFFDQFAPKISIKFFTFEPERNYIFLLCNGILVLIIRTSGVIRKSPAKNPVSKGTDVTVISQQKRTYSFEEPRLQEVTEAKEMRIHEEKERKNEGFVAEIGDRGKDSRGFDQIEEWVEEDGGEGTDHVLSADELNKKCDEFIKKVKQEIQNDSQ